MNEPQEFETQRVVDYWVTESEEALEVAYHLVEKGDYSYALFFGHLAVEKLLKALHAQRRRTHAPPIHNLLRLARLAELEPDESQTDALITVTAFNIEARYPDLKRDFRAQCTPEYTSQQMETIERILIWLKSHLA